MTLTSAPPSHAVATDPVEPLTYERVTLDLYRDIHKAIRAELFDITVAAGECDPADGVGCQALGAHVADVMDLLVQHAHHEDEAIEPVLERELPQLATEVADDHVALEHRIDGLCSLGVEVLDTPVAARRAALHRLYVELASFTSAYLAHQDLEERVVMPALETAVGVEAVIAIHAAIVGPMPPEEMARSVALMLPAMNIEDRQEFFVGMSAGAPTEVVDSVWALAGTVLEPADHAALARRLGR